MVLPFLMVSTTVISLIFIGSTANGLSLRITRSASFHLLPLMSRLYSFPEA